MRSLHAVPFPLPPPAPVRTSRLRLVAPRPEEEPLPDDLLDVEDEWVIVTWIEELQRARRALPPPLPLR